MSHWEINGCKKRRRGVERVFRFKTFGENGYPVEFDGSSSFRHNVKALLEFGHFESSLCSIMSSWSFQLDVHRHPPSHILLLVVEEPIESSLNRHCKHCQYVGWGQHMICNKKYHFVLPSKDTMAACLNCEGSCDGADTAKGKSNLMELQGHIMHGVFHSNGFGHLLCVNGMETGSDLAGHLVMEFWDRLCTGLRARKVSLTDISQKKRMELRLLHGIAYSEPWFGRWGYKFERGSFGVTQLMYQKAIEAIKGMPLCLLIHHLGNSNNDLPLIFSRYQTLSDHSLVTLGDLFHFMLELQSRLPKENLIDSYNPGILVETTCRWSPKRVEMATRVIVEALKRAEFRWVTRQEVRDAARTYIGDTGLLDFVLKSLGNHIVGNYLVRRSLNPVTKVLEYRLEDISNVFPNQEVLVMNNPKVKARYKITRAQLMKDMLHLYKYILKDQKPELSTAIFSAMPMAARIILDTKYLVKEYCGDLPSKVEVGQEGKLKLYCTIMLRNNEGDEGIKKAIPPYECVTLKNNATFDELKLEVERSFREMYWGLRSFVVESTVNLNAKGTDLVFGLVEAGRKLIFEGSNKQEGIINEVMYESGMINYVIDCPCGVKDDDGERLISCDICEVWQHTRCVRIPNNQQIPHVFLCKRCEQEIVILPSLP
uniref:Transcription factor male sterility 1 n=1 Tax=Tapiscia sinensis TaxID=112844 RepID=A0A345AHV1_9ROSI|nr:transcription factor male sterility 1 [Tapiscia sinensis]